MNHTQKTDPLGLISFSIVFALALIIPLSIENETQSAPTKLFPPQTIEINNVSDLERLVTTQSNGNRLVFAANFPKSFSQIDDINKKKQLFIQTLEPIIDRENQRLKELRAYVQEILLLSNNKISDHYKQSINQLFNRYKINNTNKTYEQAINELFNRMDTLPKQLVLAQAAMESGWGTSRFTVEGNSLFGQWTWNKNEGIKPSNRSAGATHRVKYFKNIQLSVRDYLLNINTNKAYQEIRNMRREMREQNKPYNAYKLATGLIRYSQRKEAYVKEIQQMLKSPAFSKI